MMRTPRHILDELLSGARVPVIEDAAVDDMRQRGMSWYGVRRSDAEAAVAEGVATIADDGHLVASDPTP